MTCEGTGSCDQGRHPWCCDCANLVTENSDGSDPHAETRNGVDRAIEIIGWAVLAVSVLVAVWAASKLG